VGLLACFLGKQVSMMQYCFLYSSFLDYPLQYNITDDNRLILVDIFIGKE
jgi:hypothetical protein